MTDERERIARVLASDDYRNPQVAEELWPEYVKNADALLAAGFGDVAAERAKVGTAEAERDEALAIISTRSGEASDARFAEQDMREERDALQARIDAALDAHNGGGELDGDQRALDMYRALVPHPNGSIPYAGAGREYMVNTNGIPRNHGGLGQSPISTNAFIDFKPRAENSGEKFLENDV